MPDQIDSNYKVASEFSAIFNQKPSRKKNAKKTEKGSQKRFVEFMHESLVETEVQPLAFDAQEQGIEKDEILIKLQDEVFSKGDTLRKKITLETIKDYKKAVSDFLAYFVSHAYDFKQTPEVRISYRQPKSSTIRLINEKLEKFATELFTNQLKQLDILERVDEIKGLIIDLLK
ncbi:MAG: DUF327 family protein [Treponemataceae bacterium]